VRRRAAAVREAAQALGLLKRELGLGRRQAFEAARTAESVMHALCFADPATQATIRENYHKATERQGT
jgi:polyketide biosynthesis enoyl-CoA hydratase PksI